MSEPEFKNTPERLAAFRSVIDAAGIDPTDTSYSGGEDAASYLNNETPIKRFCVLTRSGDFDYAYANSDTIEEAKEWAMINVADDCFAETPVAIIDLDTGARIVPLWSTTQWEEEKP